jgi:hypothetical protein
MQSSYFLPADVAPIWQKHVREAGLQVEPVTSGTHSNETIVTNQPIEGVWEAYSADVTQIRIIVDVWRNVITPEGQMQIDIHWCSDVGLPDRAASKKLAYRIQTILLTLGGISESTTISI